MRKVFILVALLVINHLSVDAQNINDVISWKCSIVSEVIDSQTEVEILFSAKLAEGWSLYACGFKSSQPSPKPLGFLFSENGSFEVLKYPVPIAPLKLITNEGEKEVLYFTNHAEFWAKIRILEPTADICGVMRGQVFNKNGEHLNFDRKFQF